jgi:hypothetical protein
MATCSYTSAEGRACRNPQNPGPYCVHHTCGMCGDAKQSRRIACEPCIRLNSSGGQKGALTHMHHTTSFAVTQVITQQQSRGAVHMCTESGCCAWHSTPKQSRVDALSSLALCFVLFVTGTPCFAFCTCEHGFAVLLCGCMHLRISHTRCMMRAMMS